MANRYPRLKALVVLALVATSALTLRGSNAAPRAHVSRDLLSHLTRHTTFRTRVIVHGTDADVDAIAAKYHLTVVRRVAGGAVVLVSPDELNGLTRDPLVSNLSGDALVKNTMSISNTSTAADQVRAGYSGLLLGLGAVAPVTGQGVGIAVVDSGIAAHSALANRVVANVSFVTGDSSTSDAFGHGTHVAGIIAGVNTKTTSLYNGGIAPGASLINVRVLGADGSGYTSDVIAGIDWVIANKAKYNIRVMNLSLGHSVNEPCAIDPLCQAVGRAYAAGIVVVAAAGNYGVSPDGRMILGGIVSPGNSPFALTVGAINTMGTTSRGDDVVTTYSSRGPTEYDFIVKPDVAAPGNKIVSLEAYGSYLSRNYPTLHKAGAGTNAYMQLSGTSMATPMVSGAVALLLQGTPSLIPAQVKFSMQIGATYMPDAGLIGAGAGSVNFWSSRKFIANGLINNLLNTIASLLGGGSGVSYWDSGTMAHRVYNRTGLRLLSLTDLLAALVNPAILKYGDLNLVGLTNPLANLTGNRLVWGQVAGWTGSQDEILWGSTIYSQSGDEILWGSSGGDEILWGSSVLTDDDAR
jgi:serine protease AprX